MESRGIGGAMKAAGDVVARVIRRSKSEGRLVFHSSLSARVFRRDGRVEDLGVISRKKVTTAYVNKLVDMLQGTNPAEVANFKYHDSGTGTNAENKTDTALQTPTGVAREVGSQTEGASGNVYKTVATITYDGSYAVTEHGLFDASTVGTLMDRSVFSAISVGNGDKIEFTYQHTCADED